MTWVTFAGPIVNRFDIYTINQNCRTKLQEYVDLNPCDTAHASAFQTMDNDLESYKAIVYFLYSICEFCCDCIPIGATVDSFKSRKLAGTLLSIKRGNCAAHFVADTCRIWPNVGEIRKRKRVKGGDAWCGEFNTWRVSPFAENWGANDNVEGLTDRMVTAMTDLAKFAQCHKKRQWQDCARMEIAENKI